LYAELPDVVCPFELFEIGRRDSLQFLYQLEDPDNLSAGLGWQGIKELPGRTSAVFGPIEINPSLVHKDMLTCMLTYFKRENRRTFFHG
jgi:hypothetical protein